MIVIVGVSTGCSVKRYSTTTTRGSVSTAPAEPVVNEQRTTTESETRTSQ